MATGKDLKIIAQRRLKTAKLLMNVRDWEGAAYMMGYVLECALKSAACKALRLASYPVDTKISDVDSYFRTHRFDKLLIVSGLSDVFSASGIPQVWQNYSDFTFEYPGDWPSMRYDPNRIWGQPKVTKLYDNLTNSQFGILKEIGRRKRW